MGAGLLYPLNLVELGDTGAGLRDIVEKADKRPYPVPHMFRKPDIAYKASKRYNSPKEVTGNGTDNGGAKD
jgi:hypothetical protein